MSKGMYCAASLRTASPSSGSSMVCMEIFLTMTEWPLTEVATCLPLKAFSEKILLILPATLPLSTIMESTTISLARGSTPMWLTITTPRLRRSSTVVMLFDPMSTPSIVLFDPKPHISVLFYPAAVVRTARGFFFSATSPPLLLLSIQRSRSAFLNFQRFPSLKAGILFSDRYLYSVSGLTPRYSDACRMFITSGDSDITRCPFQCRNRRLHTPPPSAQRMSGDENFSALLGECCCRL